MTTLPWWFDLLTATSDTDSSDDEWMPPSPRDTLVRQRAVANDTPESETESDSETESEASIDIEHTDDDTESDPEPTTSDEEFIVLDDTP